MNKFRKISAAALAAALMAGTALTANAEQSQVKLLTANPFDLNDSGYGGGGYFNTNDGFFKIGEEELEKWRETGKLDPVKIECDIDAAGLSGWSGSFDEGSYAQFVKRDSDGNVTERYILHLDKVKNKIEAAYTLGADWCYTRPDGYTFIYSISEDRTTMTYAVYSPDGKKVENTLTGYDGVASVSDKYVGLVSSMVSNTSIFDDYDDISRDDYIIYGVLKDGTLEEIDRIEKSYGVWFSAHLQEDAYVFYNANVPAIMGKTCIHSFTDNKSYDVGRRMDSGIIIDNVSYFYGTKAIVVSSGEQPSYQLVNIGEDDTDFVANIISKIYKHMSSDDGKIYLVKTEDDKWGYIDANGKELAIFDDAGSFIGDFAPVLKDGKAYLIDRNMNKVSEEIAAKGVQSLGEDMFVVTTDDGQELLMTYDSKPTTLTSEPTSEPTSTPISEPTSTPTSEPSDNPATGATGIAATFGVIAIATGAVIVAKKRNV